MQDVTLGATVDFKFTTAAATGAPTTLSGTPVISAYVDNSVTQITAGITLTVDFDSVTGLNNVRVVATSGNGYTTGTNIALVITTGTVDSVSVVGYKVAEFSIGRASTANVTQFGGTAGTFASGRPEVNTTHWAGTANATPDTAGHPKVTIKSGTGTGELSITSGIASVNATQINGVAAAAVRLALSAGAMLPGTVDSTFTPTATEFECDDITEATADHFIGRIALFTSGALQYQQTLIQDYSLSSGRGHFTVSTLTEAPANDDTLIIV